MYGNGARIGMQFIMGKRAQTRSGLQQENFAYCEAVLSLVMYRNVGLLLGTVLGNLSALLIMGFVWQRQSDYQFANLILTIS